MNDINSFTFFRNYYEVIKELPKELQTEFLIGILEFMFENKEPSFDGLNKAIWNLIERPLTISKNKAKNSKKDELNEIKSKSNQNQTEIKSKSNQNQTETFDTISLSISNSISNKEVEDRVVGEEEGTEEPKKEQKKHFAEFVTMTNAEYEKLISTYGETFTNRCIEVLDNYKGSKGKTYKSDYRAVLSWVVGKVQEEQTKIENEKKKANQQQLSWQEKEEMRMKEVRENFLRGE